jgi:hypothetical protein
LTINQDHVAIKQKKLVDERTLLEKEKQIEYNKLSNRLKRNWKVIVELIGVVASIATVIEVYLLLIHW